MRTQASDKRRERKQIDVTEDEQIGLRHGRPGCVDQECCPAVNPGNLNPAYRWDGGGLIPQQQDTRRRLVPYQSALRQIFYDPPVEILQPADFRKGLQSAKNDAPPLAC